MPAPTFTTLPSDVLLLIADLLPGPDVIVLTRTSKRVTPVFDHVLYSRNARFGNSLALQWGAFHNRVETVKKALAAGADVKSKRYPPSHHLHDQYKDYYRVTKSTQEIPCRKPLELAAPKGHLQIASLLIDAGALIDANPRECSGSVPLIAAVEGHQFEMVKLLVSRGVAVDTLAERGTNILSKAAATVSTDLMRYLVGEVRDPDLHARLLPGPFISAVQKQRPEIVQLLLECGFINPELADATDRTALQYACRVPEDTTGTMVRLLLDSGRVDPSQIDSLGRTTLALAARAGHAAAVALLLARPDVDPDLADRRGLTAMHHSLPHRRAMQLLLISDRVTVKEGSLFPIAIDISETEIKRQLVKLPPHHHSGKDEQGRSWLHAAASDGQVDILKLLLQRGGIRVDHQSHDGSTPLMCAIRNRRRVATNVLLDAGADVNLVTAKGWSALCYASQNSSIGLVAELIRRGGNVKQTTLANETALHFACQRAGIRVVQILLAYGGDSVLRATDGRTPLHVACLARREDIVDLLLFHIRRGHRILRKGRTALHDASKCGHVGIAKRLIAHGADPVAKLEDGTTPLELASCGHDEVTQLLLQCGANVQQKTSFGATPLHNACYYDSPDTASILLEHGADPNAVDASQSTPLHNACRHGSSRLVRLLVRHGARVTVLDKDGQAPLHHLSWKVTEDAAASAQILLENGADANVKRDDGQTPLHLACKSTAYDMMRLLLQYGADPLAAFLDDTAGTRIKPIFRDDNAPRDTTAVHLACRLRPATPALIMLLDKLERPLKEIWTKGWTPLHEAAVALNGEAVKLLLNRGAYAGALTERGRSAMHEVFAQPRLGEEPNHTNAMEVVAALLATNKINLSQSDKRARTVVSEAVTAPRALRHLLLNKMGPQSVVWWFLNDKAVAKATERLS